MYSNVKIGELYVELSQIPALALVDSAGGRQRRCNPTSDTISVCRAGLRRRSARADAGQFQLFFGDVKTED